ncbi:MAG TPA: trypsin-like serine protease [Nitrospiria bacterium]|nr:trypsin-like serine protease [Candidatus Manganitrophaceae bacterium]HIL33951.1 trypsin-like serine protease [Candidatus Manganitrophaceae bacterium]
MQSWEHRVFQAALLLFLLAACSNEAAIHAPVPTSIQIPPANDKVIEEIPARELLITERAFVRVAKTVIPSVVNISSVHFVRHPKSSSSENRGLFRGFLKDLFSESTPRQFRQKSLGSGFIISEEGYILTNHHVISDADQITVKLSDRREFIGKIIATDEKTDLAMIKIPHEPNLPIALLGDSARIQVGEWAIAIGNPFGLDRTVTVGVISATGRTNIGVTDQEIFLQTDASINFGNSGGPLLNVAGRVIGINTAIVASGQGIGFAIPINKVKERVDQWMTKEQTP